MTATPIEAPLSHAEKKTARLTAERDKLQSKIDEVAIDHAAALAPLDQAVTREKTTIAVLEQQRSELVENISQREARVIELELQLAKERAGLTDARSQLAGRGIVLGDCAKTLRKAQQAYDDRADAPKRQIAALEKKRDNVERRLRTHLAAVPLPALFLGREA